MRRHHRRSGTLDRDGWHPSMTLVAGHSRKRDFTASTKSREVGYLLPVRFAEPSPPDTGRKSTLMKHPQNLPQGRKFSYQQDFVAYWLKWYRTG